MSSPIPSARELPVLPQVALVILWTSGYDVLLGHYSLCNVWISRIIFTFASDCDFQYCGGGKLPVLVITEYLFFE